MTIRRSVRPKNNNSGKFQDKSGKAKIQKAKYLEKAKDALASGDRIDAEYYFQFADHYQRVLDSFGPVKEKSEKSEKQERPEKSADIIELDLSPEDITLENKEEVAEKKPVRRKRVVSKTVRERKAEPKNDTMSESKPEQETNDDEGFLGLPKFA